jgi:hypothetical protein
MVWRTANVTNDEYTSVSSIYAKAVHDILIRERSSDKALEDAQDKLRQLVARRKNRLE